MEKLEKSKALPIIDIDVEGFVKEDPYVQYLFSELARLGLDSCFHYNFETGLYELSQHVLEKGYELNESINPEDIEELLIVVDMVNGFAKKGALADPYIQHIIPEILRLICIFQGEKNKAVAFIRDAHSLDCAEFKKFPVHCVDGTWESEIIDEFQPYVANSLVFKKNSRSFMFAPGFIPTLGKMPNLKRIVSCGCCTDLCDTDGNVPMINYFDQINRDVELIVPKDAVETYDGPGHNREEYNEMAFKFMAQEGIKLVRTYNGGRR